MFIDYRVPICKICKRFVGIYIIFSVFSVIANASETNFTGFANIGLSYTKSDQLAFRTSVLNESREGLSWQSDTIIGLQVNTRFSDNIDFVGQVVFQDRFDYALTNVLELAFLRYQIDRNWSVKLGRFSTNNYLITDYRYVRHAQYWARPPLEMYGSVGVIGNMNGLQVDYVKDVYFGTIKLGLSYGRNAFRHDNDDSKFRINYENLSSAYIEFQSTNWRVKASHVTTILDDLEFAGIEAGRATVSQAPPIFQPFAMEVENHFIPEGSRVNYSTIGGRYQGEKFELIAEYADYDSKWALSQSARTGYVSFAYNHDMITSFITLACTDRKKFPQILDFARAEATLPPLYFQQLEFFAMGLDDIMRNASISQNSISVGMRWDFNIDWAVKFQVDHNRTDDSGSALFGRIGDISSPREKLILNVVNISFSTTF